MQISINAGYSNVIDFASGVQFAGSGDVERDEREEHNEHARPMHVQNATVGGWFRKGAKAEQIAQLMQELEDTKSQLATAENQRNDSWASNKKLNEQLTALQQEKNNLQNVISR